MKKIWLLFFVILLGCLLVTGCGEEGKKQTANGSFSTVEWYEKDTGKDDRGKYSVVESGVYTDKDSVAAYIHTFGHLPRNYVTKREAKRAGWKEHGTLDEVLPGKSIGGDRYGNYEEKLPIKKGRRWTECDIDYRQGNRNAKRIIFSNDGWIYYTDDHYRSFTRLY